MPYYAVHVGKNGPGIFNTWPECKEQVDGMRTAVYRKFDNYADAERFMDRGRMMEGYVPRNPKEGTASKKAEAYEAKNQDEIDTVFTDGNAHRNLIIYTDGSCLREVNKVYCGYGIVIPELGIKHSSDLDDPKRTNNRAEMRAILHAIEMVGEELRASRRLCIFTDSQYCKYIFQGTGARYEKDGFMKEGKEVPNRDMIEVALRYLRAYDLAILKVRAHTDATDIHSRYNALADGLANEGSLKQKLGRRYVPNQVIIGTPVFHDSVLHPFERRIPTRATTPQIERVGAGDSIHQELLDMDPLGDVSVQNTRPTVDPQVAHRYTEDRSWREEEKQRLAGKTGSRQILDFFLDGEEEEAGPPAPTTTATAPKPKPKVVAKVTAKGTAVKTYKSTRLDDFLEAPPKLPVQNKFNSLGALPRELQGVAIFSDDSD